MKMDNSMKKYLLLASVVFIAGCESVSTTPIQSAPNFQRIAEDAVRESMKDPESVRFKDTYQAYQLSNGDVAVCGEVNGKNSYGGYTGYTPYYVRIKNGQAYRMHAMEASGSVCDNMASGSATFIQ